MSEVREPLVYRTVAVSPEVHESVKIFASIHNRTAGDEFTEAWNQYVSKQSKSVQKELANRLSSGPLV